ncbi:MAG: hypothetical protein ACLPH3_03945 [Terracidiphilus sp.]
MSEAEAGAVVQKIPREDQIEDVERTGTSADRAIEPLHVTQGRQAQSATRPEHRSGFQRTTTAIRTLVPLVHKLLPLLDGNVATVIADLLAPRLQAPRVDTHPIEVGLARLHAEFSVLHDMDAEQNAALKRITEQLESMKDALDRTTLEQRETMEQVVKIRSRVLVFSLVGLTLLVVSIGANVALFLSTRGTLH